MTQILIRSFPDQTRERVARLESHFDREIFRDGSFSCRHFRACKESRSGFPFYEGQLHHVGPHYDLEIEGRPTRIVIVGQEYGHGPALVLITDRNAMVADSAGKGFSGRNPHMRGTTSMLRLALGRSPGLDVEGEQLMPGVHIFDGFAQLNYLLCSAIDRPRDDFDPDTFKGAGKGKSSATMRENCAEHFRAALDILNPTLVMAQGIGVRNWIGKAFQVSATPEGFEALTIGRIVTPLLTFAHPSAGGSAGYWGRSVKSAYLEDSVRPLIARWRAAAAVTSV